MVVRQGKEWQEQKTTNQNDGVLLHQIMDKLNFMQQPAATQPVVQIPETEPAEDVEMAVETPLTEGEQSNPLRARHFHMPDRFSGGGTHDVHLFTRQLRRYWTSVKFTQSLWGTTPVQFVSGKALNMWVAKLTEFEGLRILPTFEDVENVLHAAFGSQLTAHEVRVKWENLKQTSSLSDLVREERRLLFEMANTPFAPTEFDVCSHFPKVIKKDMSHFLAQNAPDGYWQKYRPLFEKAIHHECNLHASNQTTKTDNSIPAEKKQMHLTALRKRGYNVRVFGKKRKGAQSNQSNQPSEKKPKAEGKSKKAPPKPALPAHIKCLDRDWQIRWEHNQCGICGKSGHTTDEHRDRPVGHHHANPTVYSPPAVQPMYQAQAMPPGYQPNNGWYVPNKQRF